MTTQEFIFDLPLYTKEKLSESTLLSDLKQFGYRIDGYNSFRNADTTYRLDNVISDNDYLDQWTKTIRFVCQRYNDCLYILIHCDKTKDFIEKVGQYPSVADIQIAQVKKYRKVLGEEYINDFTKAIGLAANGIGTGSFVYLRRIFEHLVYEIAEEAINNGKVDKFQFESSKMDNKLKLLSESLPGIIMDNKSIYGVLSKGIHSLPENECLKYFSIVRTIIELILDDREHERLIKEKKKIAGDQLGSIVGELKNTSTLHNTK